MKQRIMHGKELDTATPAEVARIIAAAFDAQSSEDYSRRRGSIKLDATGAGEGTLEVSPQFDWLIRYIVYGGSGWVQNATIVRVFENDVNAPTSMIDIVPTGGSTQGASYSPYLFVAAGTVLHLVVTGGALNGELAFSYQIREMRRPQ